HEASREDPRLLIGALRELRAGDAAREPEVVAYQRAGGGLAANRLALDDERAQTLRRGIDRGGEPGRTRSDHDHVEVAVTVEARGHPVAAGELDVRRIDEHALVDRDHDGAVRRRDSMPGEQLPAFV